MSSLSDDRKNYYHKTLIKRIQEYANNVEKENSYDALGRIRRTIDPINALLDAMDVGDRQFSILKIPYFYTVFAVLDALNIALHNISESEIAPRCSIDAMVTDPTYRDRYDYTPLAIKLSKDISDHLTHIESLFKELDSKRKKSKNPEETKCHTSEETVDKT